MSGEEHVTEGTARAKRAETRGRSGPGMSRTQPRADLAEQ